MEKIYKMKRTGIKGKGISFKINDILCYGNNGFFGYLFLKNGKIFKIIYDWHFKDIGDYDGLMKLSADARKEELGVYYKTLDNRENIMEEVIKKMVANKNFTEIFFNDGGMETLGYVVLEKGFSLKYRNTCAGLKPYFVLDIKE